jgi:hypothetical protein
MSLRSGSQCGQASSMHAQTVGLTVGSKARPEIDTKKRRTVLGVRDQRKERAHSRTRAAAIESGDSQPQRHLKSAKVWHSLGLCSFRFLSYCGQMRVCLVFARLLSITFQRLAFR